MEFDRNMLNIEANELSKAKAKLKLRAANLLEKCKVSCLKDITKVDSEYCENKCDEEYILFKTYKMQTRIPNLKNYLVIFNKDNYNLNKAMTAMPYHKYLQNVMQANRIMQERNAKLENFINEWEKRIK